MTPDNDQQHLRLLSVFHYVLAGITGFIGLFPIIHISLGIAMLSGAMDAGQPPPKFIGMIFVGAGLAVMAGMWTLAVLALLAGRRLAQRRSYTFCFVVACIECILMPYGTVLGVFSVLVLSLASVKRLFGR